MRVGSPELRQLRESSARTNKNITAAREVSPRGGDGC